MLTYESENFHLVFEDFRMIHTLEHIPTADYLQFLKDMKRKLKPGGKGTIVLTDAEAAINMWEESTLSFRAMKKILLPPAHLTGANKFMAHHNMWNTLDLARDFQALGFDTFSFESGSWFFDLTDVFFLKRWHFHGIQIKNLGVLAVLPE